MLVASYGLNDASAFRRRIEDGVDSFMDLEQVPDVDAGERMRASKPHILVDLMAHTRGTRNALAASKPAPIVVNYLGYPGTMGGAYVDYAMVDAVAVPPETARAAFTEKLVYLPYCYQANDYSLKVPVCTGLSAGNAGNGSGTDLGALRDCMARHRPDLLPPPDTRRDPTPGGSGGTGEARGGRRLGGEAKEEILLCNFNNVDKMEPVSFQVWMDLLRRFPQALLVLMEQSSQIHHHVRGSLETEAAARGIHPSRLRFSPRLPKAQHIARLTACDIFVDNFMSVPLRPSSPCSSHGLLL